jgi:tetratricopeptide (TPR) repeat protein
MMRGVLPISFTVAGLLLLAVVWLNVWQPAEQATTIQPDPPTDLSYFELGEYYFNQDADPAGPYNLQQAKKYYRKAVREDPDGHALAWYQLGRVYFIEGKFHSAIYNFEKQVEYFDNSVPNVHYMLGLTYGYRALETNTQTDWQQAEDSFLLFIEQAPTSPWPRVDLAWVYFSQGKYDMMVPIIEEGLEHTPNQAWLLNSYGLALLNLQDNNAARAAFTKAIASYETLTVNDWAQAYSGNDPQHWNRNFKLFGETIEYNLELTINN